MKLFSLSDFSRNNYNTREYPNSFLSHEMLRFSLWFAQNSDENGFLFLVFFVDSSFSLLIVWEFWGLQSKVPGNSLRLFSIYT